MLVKGDTVGIICCSDGRKKEDENRIALLEQVLKTEFSLQVVFAETIFQKLNRHLVVLRKLVR